MGARKDFKYEKIVRTDCLDIYNIITMSPHLVLHFTKIFRTKYHFCIGIISIMQIILEANSQEGRSGV